MVSKYRAKLNSVIKPSGYLSMGTGILFLTAILIKEDFQIDPKMIEVALLLVAGLFIFCEYHDQRE